jgi:tryptophan synthase alpha chain
VTEVAGDARLRAAFAEAGERGQRAALMPYLMGGFPDVASSLAIGHACVDAGASVLEIGIPYADPLADGPVIHAAGTRALAAGTTTAAVLDVAAELAQRVPVVLFAYGNLVLARGVEAFAAELAGRGISGMIIPDLPLEEAPAWRDAFDAAGLALVPLAAPTTPEDRLREIGALARGFLYTVSVTGTTGERAGGAAKVADVIARAKAASTAPVALGFGISTPDDAVAAAAAGADGVIVGSRFVRAAAEAAEGGDDPAAAVGELAGAMAAALSR